MRNNTFIVTSRDIASFRRDAEANGDLEQAALCVLALGGREALRGAERGSEWARLYTSRRTQGSALRECERLIREARAEMDA